jgi:hypothetical protein
MVIERPRAISGLTASEQLSCGKDSAGEVFYLGPRLLAKNPSVHDELERMKAEADFKDAIAPPLPVVVGALLLHLHVHPVVAAICLAASALLAVDLFRHARIGHKEANSVVAHAIADGLIDTAAIQRYEAVAESRQPERGARGLPPPDVGRTLGDP